MRFGYALLTREQLNDELETVNPGALKNDPNVTRLSVMPVTGISVLMVRKYVPAERLIPENTV